MKRPMFTIVTAVVLAASYLSPQGLAAAGDPGAVFAYGLPLVSSALPAGELRSALEGLPEAEHVRALQWLQSIEFTSHDLDAMKLDTQGGIYYADHYTLTGVVENDAEKVAAARSLTPDTVFQLHSKPGAPGIIHIDFSGGMISDTAWNRNAGVQAWDAQPFDMDNRPDTFSGAEVSAMAEIWRQISEDFAPFNIDVTTERPKSPQTARTRVLVTRSMDREKRPLPEPSSGNVVYMNIAGFGLTEFYSPALVYHDNLVSTAAIAEASSHAIGHMFGLSHDSMPTPGVQGSGKLSWSPIMGLGPHSSVSQWSKGDYSGAVNSQNDIGILIGALDPRRDDHDDSRFGEGTLLQVDALGQVTASTPENDPWNRYSANKGIIEAQDDIDIFVFDAAEGMVDLTVTPAWLGVGSGNPRGANLDVQLTMFDIRGRRLTQQSLLDETQSRIRKHVEAGRYILEVSAVGGAASANTAYGNLGQYFINGHVPAAAEGAVRVSTRRAYPDGR